MKWVISPDYDVENQVLTFATRIKTDHFADQVYTECIDFKSKVVRRILIMQGWTPPDGIQDEDFYPKEKTQVGTFNPLPSSTPASNHEPSS